MKKRLLAISAALALSGVIGLTVFIGGTNEKGLPDPVLGISFPYTDDNTGETLHIYSSDTSYTNGLSHAEVYLAVVNNSGKKQDVELLAYFEDSKKRVSDVAVLGNVTRVRTVPVIENVCRDVVATTTDQSVSTVCRDEEVSSFEETYEQLEWQPIALVERSINEKNKETLKLVKGSVSRKADSKFITSSKSQGVTQNEGEVVYYKVVIQFEPNNSGNFFFEAIGSEGGYGHLQ